LKTILDSKKFNVVIQRLCHQLLENHSDFSSSVIIGIQPRGILLANRIVDYIEKNLKRKLHYGKLDITFYRDDFNTGNQLIPDQTDIPFTIEGKKVILIDDVLFTGRTIRSALDAILDFGRPDKVELLTLVDRRYSRQLPIQADYVGITVDALISEKVKVQWQEQNGQDKVVLMKKENETQKKS
jgi:pyrimidine operon attenuation protein/uracil phosphoribosyltransferase